MTAFRPELAEQLLGAGRANWPFGNSVKQAGRVPRWMDRCGRVTLQRHPASSSVTHSVTHEGVAGKRVVKKGDAETLEKRF